MATDPPPQATIPPSQPPRDVWATLNYYRDPGDGSLPKPVYVNGNTVTNDRPIEPTRCLVHDVTGTEATYDLDTHGFQLVAHETSIMDFNDGEEVKREYYPECEELYKSITGASQVHIFGHLVRRGPANWHSLGVDNALRKGPLHRVHIDQSDDGAADVLKKFFPELLAALLQETASKPKRWAILNIWRPLSTIYASPLALASAPSISPAHLREATVTYTQRPPPHNVNKTLAVLPTAAYEHKWYYKNEMTRGEVWLFKCFDTRKQGARWAPHCAFVDQERRVGWAERESVEVRAVLVWDD